jgi:serine/threonine-protein kinase
MRCGTPRAPDARFCQRCGASFAAPTDPLVGEVLMGRYRVAKVLGEGTMGRVYLGEQRVGEGLRPVAIKVLAAARGNDDYIVARFRREASTIASLEHPNIIKIYDYGEEAGRFLSVMEDVPGGSLAALIHRGRLAPARVEAIAWQIASALDVAHRRRVVHRDLKPENVLLVSSLETGGADVVKVVDFGIARRPPSTPHERPLTITGAMLGTPAFMAPEQFMGEAADARADVYALALVVYQMLSGVLPWAGGTVMEWGEAHMNQAPRPLRTQPGCADLPERYDAAIARALTKNVRNRTPSTLEFVRDLTGSSQPGASASPAAAIAVTPGGLPAGGDDFAPPVRRTSPVVIALVLAAIALAGAVAAYFVVQLVGAPRTVEGSAPDAAVDATALAKPPAPAASSASAVEPSRSRDAGAPRPDAVAHRNAARAATSARASPRSTSPRSR